MISIFLNPLQAIDVKTDFNSFYEEEQYPYSKLLNLIQNSKIPLNKTFRFGSQKINPKEHPYRKIQVFGLRKN